jgi:hypothetical protein
MQPVRFTTRLLVRALTLAGLTLAWTALAQHQPQQMDAYVQTFLTSGPLRPTLNITNLYTAPLVAVSWSYKCDEPPIKGFRGFQDSALWHASPLAKGTSQSLANLGTCKGGLTAILFADGKVIGDPLAIKQIYDRRAFAYDETTTFSGPVRQSGIRFKPYRRLRGGRQH